METFQYLRSKKQKLVGLSKLTIGGELNHEIKGFGTCELFVATF